jgi:hypothetical protein
MSSSGYIQNWEGFGFIRITPNSAAKWESGAFYLPRSVTRIGLNENL